MSKMLEIETCQECWHATDESVADYSPLCEYDETHRPLNEDYIIPAWCPLPEKAGWLPIESAPKNTVLWLWDGEDYGVGFAAETKEEETATHYMLPSPPETTK